MAYIVITIIETLDKIVGPVMILLRNATLRLPVIAVLMGLLCASQAVAASEAPGEQTLSAQPNHVLKLNLMALQLQDRGLLNKAEAKLREALAISPASIPSNIAISRLLSLKGNPAGAKMHLENAAKQITLDAAHHESQQRLVLGRALLGAGFVGEAKKQLATALSMAEAESNQALTSKIHLALASSLSELDQFSEAEFHFDEAKAFFKARKESEARAELETQWLSDHADHQIRMDELTAAAKTLKDLRLHTSSPLQQVNADHRLALIMYRFNNFDNAAAVLSIVIENLEGILGKSHPEVEVARKDYRSVLLALRQAKKR